jgi:hypothetical protein
VDITKLLYDPRRLLPDFPAITVNDRTAGDILQGRNVHLPVFSGRAYVKVFAFEDDCLIAICKRIAGQLFHPCVVLGRTNPGTKAVRAAKTRP